MSNIGKVSPKFQGNTNTSYIQQGNDRYNNNDFYLAIAYYNAEIILQKSSVNTANSDVYFNRGCARMAVGLFEDAAQDFSTYLSTNPFEPEAQEQLNIAKFLTR